MASGHVRKRFVSKDCSCWAVLRSDAGAEHVAQHLWEAGS